MILLSQAANLLNTTGRQTAPALETPSFHGSLYATEIVSCFPTTSYYETGFGAGEVGGSLRSNFFGFFFPGCAAFLTSDGLLSGVAGTEVGDFTPSPSFCATAVLLFLFTGLGFCVEAVDLGESSTTKCATIGLFPLIGKMS